MRRRLCKAALLTLALALLIPQGAGAAHSLRYTIDTWESSGVKESNEGPCGAAVDSVGNLYVSDYYHDRVNVFSSSGTYITQIGGINPLNGPCGLAIAADGTIYVNLYHQGVAVLDPGVFPPGKSTVYANSGELLAVDATGIALDSASGNLLVNERTGVAEYELPLTKGEVPLRTIGAASLSDSYGLAVSGFGATDGVIYAADAGDSTVKAYDPEISLSAPVQVLGGADTPLGRFNELTDAALALNDDDGHLFVADNVDGRLFESPRASIEEFEPSGSFLEQLKPTAIDGEPVGLAVDNTGSATQGDVYVTSGNSEGAGVLAFGHWTPNPPEALATPSGGGGAAGSATASTEQTSQPASTTPGAQHASASVVSQKGTLRVAVDGKMSPTKLPRRGTSSVSVSVSGEVSTTDGSVPPRLARLEIEINRHGHLDLQGLPLCPISRIQPASTARALSACRSALVGQGHFSAESSLSGGEPYPTQGRLLLFNAREGGRPVLYGHIYATRPFTSSHVIPFAIGTSKGGSYGTELVADLASSLGERSRLTGIEMTLSRRYRYRGRARSFLSAGCPAPKGFSRASFPLTRTSFGFSDGKELRSTLMGSCRARG